MKTMKLYFISKRDLGNQTNLFPRVPPSIMRDVTDAIEDDKTERICCAPTVTGCIRALNIPMRFYSSASDYHIHFWLYSADVPVDLIIQPTQEQVPDVWITCELWVIKPYIFTLVSECVGNDFNMENNIIVNRFNVNFVNVPKIKEEITEFETYGDITSFSMINMVNTVYKNSV